MAVDIDTSEAHALALDAADQRTVWRDEFLLPSDADGQPIAYLAGDSLGAQPRAARAAVEHVLERWAGVGVEAWFGDGGWLTADGAIREATGRVVGARPVEVATCNTLTVNLHLLLTAFFRPAGRRTAILVDAPTFPSDQYAVASQLRHHGLDPGAELIVVRPRTGESLVRHEDLEGAIHEHRERLAVALLAGVNYATGARLDIERLTGRVHEAGAIAIWDLAHAAGNVPLALHDAEVDAAAWCTYKYLNSGPGALAQLFVHERHDRSAATRRLTGWWGNDEATRFAMAEEIDPAHGAAGWRISTTPMLSFAPIAASLAIVDRIGMPALRERSVALTAYLEAAIDGLASDVELVTPRDPTRRGAQLSLRVARAAHRQRALEAHGVVGDFREPDIVRLAPVPLYNTFHDAWRAARALADTTATDDPAPRSPE
jgi:kynureninase